MYMLTDFLRFTRGAAIFILLMIGGEELGNMRILNVSKKRGRSCEGTGLSIGYG